METLATGAEHSQDRQDQLVTVLDLEFHKESRHVGSYGGKRQPKLLGDALIPCAVQKKHNNVSLSRRQ